MAFFARGVPGRTGRPALAQRRNIPLHEASQQVIYTPFYTKSYTNEGRMGPPANSKRRPRSTRERYLQWFEPTRAYRFRRAVPIHLRAIIGLSEWTDTLSPNHDEAKRSFRLMSRELIELSPWLRLGIGRKSTTTKLRRLLKAGGGCFR